jgi:hypothetical protein
VTGRDLVDSTDPLRDLGIFAPPRVQDDARGLARMFGEKIGALTIPPVAGHALAQTIAVMVMYPDAPGKTGTQILDEARERWGTPAIKAKADHYIEKHGVASAETGLALLKRVMDPILTEIGDRNVPEEANHQLVQAIGYVIAAELAA